MADMTNLTTDPFFSILQNVQDVKTKVSDSIFENYKLQVAQTNDINNRAMQVALHDASALADLKQATSEGTLQAMLAAARTDAAIGQTAAATQRAIADANASQQRLTMEQAEMTRRLEHTKLEHSINQHKRCFLWSKQPVRWSRSCVRWRRCRLSKCKH